MGEVRWQSTTSRLTSNLGCGWWWHKLGAVGRDGLCGGNISDLTSRPGSTHGYKEGYTIY